MSGLRTHARVLGAAVLAVVLAAWTEAQSSYPEVDRSVLDLISDLNSYRERVGLEPVLPDTGRCDVFARVVSRFVSDENMDFFGAEGLDKLDYYVSDIEKRCFIVGGRSRRQAIQELEQSPGFMDALMAPDMTHLSAAFGEIPDGGTWCAACISERLVHIVNTLGSGSPAGGFLDFYGRTRFEDVMVEYFERPTDEGDQDTTTYHAQAEMRESGAFRVGLSYGIEGGPRKGTIDIVFYARNDEDEPYRPTNRLSFHIPEPPRMQDLNRKRPN